MSTPAEFSLKLLRKKIWKKVAKRKKEGSKIIPAKSTTFFQKLTFSIQTNQVNTNLGINNNLFYTKNDA